MARYFIRPVLKKTRSVDPKYFSMIAASGCPHCGSAVDLRSHSAHGGKVGICNHESCPARVIHLAYYYVSETTERVFPLKLEN
jgi:hypothetical protein